MQLNGHIVREELDSKLLEQNPAGVSAKRPLTIYLPEETRKDQAQRFPVLYCLAPWTNAGRTQFDWRPFKLSLPERVERLRQQSQMPPAIIVAVDLYSFFGGSQYIDSDYFGLQAKHIVEEVFPYIEAHYPAKPGWRHRAVFGRSSGGFGAVRLAMDYPKSVNAIACHSGDMGFELLFTSDLSTLPDHLSRFNSDPLEFIQYSKTADKLTGRDIHVLMLLGMAGYYSAKPDSAWGFELPIDLKTGAIKADVLKRWIDHDPVRRIDRTYENLKSLGCLYLECGRFDQYRLLYGARQLKQKFDRYGLAHHYYEFDDNHSGTDYRYDVSLPLLTKAID